MFYVKRIFMFFVILIVSGCASYYPTIIDDEELQEAIDEAGAIKNMKKYSDLYLFKSSEIKKNQFKINDARLSLALAGLLAGFSGEAKGAAAGSLIGNLIDIPNTRYNFEVQSVNYAKASDAMACMYDYLESQEQTRSLSYKLLNAKIYQVHRKLNILQNDVQLAEPDLKVIESALSEIKKERDAQNIRDTSARRSTPSEPSEKEKIAELDSCIAAFSK